MKGAFEWARQGSAVAPVERLILVLLANYADEQGRGVLPGDQTIADFILCDDAYAVPEWLDAAAMFNPVVIHTDRSYTLGPSC